MKTSLKRAGSNDIPSIYKLAVDIWNKYYISIISQEQIDYMLDKFYSPEAMESSMQSGEMFYLIEYNSEAIGYLALTEKKQGEWFMNKYYLKPNHQRSGLGTEAFKIWENMAKPEFLRLQVNRQNFKSINFYFKNGFTIQEVADFDIGNGFIMDDFIMVKKYIK